MSINKNVGIEKRDGIAFIIMKRSETLNVLSTEMLQDLGDSFVGIENDGETRVVIITGEKKFSAGADIRELKDKSPEEAAAFARLAHGVFKQIETMGKPVIAAVNGFALGGGCELALACDIRMAAENAKFGQPEINLGLIPCFGGTQRLPRLIGIGRAMELILTGRMIDGKTAESVGLVNRAVREEELMEQAEETARILARKSPIALRMAKRLINRHLDIERGLEMEIASIVECYSFHDYVEGIAAFLEKREARFEGR